MKGIKSKFINYKSLIYSGISFIFGFMIAVNLYPIEKTCRIKDTDKEYNIMNNGKLRTPDLIGIIMSAPRNLDKRNTIRETWLKLIKPQQTDNRMLIFKYYFVIGSLNLSIDDALHLSSEQSKYNDILLLPLAESYNNLTYKILQTFKWLDEQINYQSMNFRYILKCDDDSFVRIDNLLQELFHIETIYLKSKNFESVPESPYITVDVQLNKYFSPKDSSNELCLYWGYFSGNARIFNTGKWQEDSYILCDYYLPYARGGGYIISKKLVRYLAANAELLRLYKSEDVSIGTWLSPINNILRLHDTRFDTEYKSRGCKNFHIISHNLNVSQMRTYYNNIKSTGNMCVKEFSTRGNYLYNWQTMPSKCCQKMNEYLALNKLIV